MRTLKPIEALRGRAAEYRLYRKTNEEQIQTLRKEIQELMDANILCIEELEAAIRTLEGAK